MNARLFKRELSNIVMLGRIAKSHGLKVFFWSLADGCCRRLHMDRLCEKTHYKRHEACKDYLKKKYQHIIKEYQQKQFSDIAVVGLDSPVWRYWHQGEKNVPYPVDITLKSTERRCGQHPIKILNASNYQDYVTIPDYIIEKCEKKQMNIAVFSDFLRLALLKEYGGIWLDSTFFVSDSFPGEIDNLSFYSIKQANKRKWVVTKDLWSVCMLAAGPQNPLISFCYDFLAEYWKSEITPVAYLMTDCIIAIGYEEIPVIRELIDHVPDNNLHSFDFLCDFRNKPADFETIQSMRQDTYVYQLSYKYDWKTYSSTGEMTNFGALVSGATGETHGE